ncbi:hypothetical protein [Exiguobacterium aurantiacum]|uniref:Uncharacterized protein n=1 Tax=Exiguobacterium aurantiacum TaxID=33987 RepID=A0ABY5FS33_9BACL|nr:hypothetical protein [Exiguobacterium aurantiacum]UTT44335.1 hypothetical protein NMQ00_07510 [Exiguobacterium aurantiacum]
MDRLLQACLTGQVDYKSAEGVTFYRAPTSGHRQHAIVLDILIDRYVLEPGRPIELSVADVANSIGLSADEVFRSVMALARITLVSQHIEERLIRFDSAGIDERGKMTLIIGFNAWLTHHLGTLAAESIERSLHAHVI